MADFDPLKAAREELAGLMDVIITVRASERSAEAAMARAEAELNAARKLRGFAEITIGSLRERIARIEAERQP